MNEQKRCNGHAGSVQEVGEFLTTHGGFCGVERGVGEGGEAKVEVV